MAAIAVQELRSEVTAPAPRLAVHKDRPSELPHDVRLERWAARLIRRV